MVEISLQDFQGEKRKETFGFTLSSFLFSLSSYYAAVSKISPYLKFFGVYYFYLE